MSEAIRSSTEEDLEFLRMLLRDLTHEIAAPLTPLFGHLDLLELRSQERLNPMQARCVGAMRRSLRRLTAINDRMLELARLERGHIPCAPIPVAPEAVLVEVARRFQKQADARRVTISTEPGEPVMILADWNLLVIALGHLLENALRYAPEGSSVALGVALGEEHCELTVEDRGPAVPEREIERIVSPFYRVSDQEGYTETAGLGLTIVDLIARRHGGRLSFSLVAPEDAENPGLSARLSVPRAK
ncbi:MAG: ATP-binding protein [Polyangia bacterium]|jgi:signal transduction histidine kinase|nr:ATP-binding protein [Polyangia bacterium]